MVKVRSRQNIRNKHIPRQIDNNTDIVHLNDLLHGDWPEPSSNGGYRDRQSRAYGECQRPV